MRGGGKTLNEAIKGMPVGGLRLELAWQRADGLNSEGGSTFHLPRYVSKN